MFKSVNFPIGNQKLFILVFVWDTMSIKEAVFFAEAAWAHDQERKHTSDIVLKFLSNGVWKLVDGSPKISEGEWRE